MANNTPGNIGGITVVLHDTSGNEYSYAIPNAFAWSRDNQVLISDLVDGSSNSLVPGDVIAAVGFNVFINAVNALYVDNVELASPVFEPNSCAGVWYYDLGLEADVNRDCTVDMPDLAMMAGQWLDQSAIADPNE